ncbi:MAG TPA: PASTA domain-containing protein [Acidimicrobiales bacterium]|nr:PASTA domain-containing protein [Acidimicrobiales bacterium]
MPLISDAIGRVLGKRYRLVSALGTGASAHVFLAEDVSLQRHVAVKVLQPDLVNDQAFLKRFRAEARSVASLNHPHVLRVFDWGEDTDGPYLVLEYLGGGSLRDMLDRGVRLSAAQAARVGSQAAEGLAYAHARGLVHRDVKPANLLFDEEGRVRVADFGVARALAEAAWTEPEGAMIGTARYAAPEQAQGQPVDGRADVYALALVLYESVTGVVPFTSDTTVGTLMARIGAPLPHHEALGPLDNVLARAAAPEPAARLDAAGLAARLDALSAALAPPAPLALAGEPVEPALAAPTTGFRAPTPDDLTGVVAATTATATTVAGGPATEAGPHPGVRRGAEVAAVALPPTAVRRRRRRWPWVVTAVVLAGALVAGLLVAFKDKVFTPSHPVPAVTGLGLAAARAALARDHLSLAVHGTQYSIRVPPGRVISQAPAARSVVKEGATVAVVASRGLPDETFPSLTGLDCTGAQRVLTVAHLLGVCPAAAAAYESDVPAGQVINWSWDNHLNVTVAPYGASVIIAISKGPAPVPVPTVPTDSYGDAAGTLRAAGFAPAETQQLSTSVPAGQVIGTTPAAGTSLVPGSTVTVVVSEGPPMVGVPDVTGESVAKATTDLASAGLVLGNVYGPAHGTVFALRPTAGTQVPQGSAVDVYTQ